MSDIQAVDLPLPGLPGLLDIRVRYIRPTDNDPHPDVEATLVIRKDMLNPAGTAHAGTVVALADTACGYGCLASLPEGKSGFTTLELKSNHVGTAFDGDTIVALATAVHRGGSTQVWDAKVTALPKETGRPRAIAVFRCTQYLLGTGPTAPRE